MYLNVRSFVTYIARNFVVVVIIIIIIVIIILIYNFKIVLQYYKIIFFNVVSTMRFFVCNLNYFKIELKCNSFLLM
jgi:hypothetical protein